MRSLGAIIIGIGAYRYDRLQYPLLRYAASDSDKVARYFATCWPNANDVNLICLADANATETSVADAFRAVGQGGPYDLQFIFFSGHGFVSPESAGLVLQPPEGSTALSLLDSAQLDQLLTSVEAKRTVLILDCCYAEGITKRMSFFSALGQSDARLFVASSRESQLTWEDESVGQGIFTAHLLDLLNTGSSVKLKGVRDQLDVDGELFPVLCDQVPLYVLEHKQQRQEPVKGGISIRAVTLPVSRAARRIKERTAFGTAIRRLRQIVVAAASVLVAFLFFAYILAYYAEADRNGNIRLHHGTKWLHPVFRFLPTTRADSGISSADLSDDPANRYAIQAGETSGFWTHMSRQGYRSWYDAIRPSLDSVAVTRYDVLVAAAESRPVYRLNEESAPSDVKLAAWALLDDSDSNQLNTLLAHILGADRTSQLLTPFSVNDLDFNILDRPQSQLASFADALRSAAAVDPDRTFIAYLGFLKANQVWLTHSSPEEHGEEAQRRAADDVADVLKVIAKARLDRGESALDATMISQLNQLDRLGYSSLVHLALSRTTATASGRDQVISHALSVFQGDTTEPAQAAAIRQLKDCLDSSPSSQTAVLTAYRRFVASGGPERSDLTGFLIAAADKKAIPSAVITIVLDKARQAVGRRDRQFLDTEYARILAHAMSQVPESSRTLVYRLIELVASDVTPMASSTAEMYNALGRQGLDTPEIFERIVAQAGAAPPYQRQNPSAVAEPLPGLSIVVGYGPWLETLAVLGRKRSLNPKAIEILKRHADDPSVRYVIVQALAHQSGLFEPGCWKTGCRRIFEGFPNDGAGRELAADVLAEELGSLRRSDFVTALETLRKERQSESEPEVRIALSLATMNAQMVRVRTTAVGSQLFE